MQLRAIREGPATRYTLLMDDIEKGSAIIQEGDTEFIRSSAKSPLISEKLLALALICKRIEEGRAAAAEVPPNPAPVNQ